MKTCDNSLVESPVAAPPQPRPKKLIVKILLVDIRKRNPQFSKHIHAVDRKRPTQTRRLVIPSTRKQPPPTHSKKDQTYTTCPALSTSHGLNNCIIVPCTPAKPPPSNTSTSRAMTPPTGTRSLLRSITYLTSLSSLRNARFTARTKPML